MLFIIPFFLVLWAILGHKSVALPVDRASIQVVYHVGDIVEHAYTHEATSGPNLNPYPLHQPQPPNVQQFVQPLSHIGHRETQLQQPLPSSLTFMDRPSMTSVALQSTTTTTTTTTPTTTTTTPPAQSKPSTTAATTSNPKPQNQPSKPSTAAEPSGKSNPNDSNETNEAGDGADYGQSTEQSLAAFLAMLEETRHAEAEVMRKREERKLSTGHFSPVPPVPATPATAAAAAQGSSLPASARPGRNPFHDWAVYDDLDTQESNQTAVIASSQKFGYVVNGNNYKRFRVEEKASNGLINGLYGFHHHNGNIRGVQYTADPSINPKFLYDTLVKFFST